MKLYQIDQGIKVPPVSHGKAGTNPSPAFETMQLLKKGDSFFVKNAVDAVHANKVMRDLMTRERARGGKRVFTSRKIDGGTRIWRIK